jgi:hypothetical protein
MTIAAMRRCSRCRQERPLAWFTSGASGPGDLCSNCRGFDNAARNRVALLWYNVIQVEGGWRLARTEQVPPATTVPPACDTQGEEES